MPSYDWNCHSCNKSNLAHADVCSFCGFSAVATGEKIKEARKSRIDYVHPGGQDNQAQPKPAGPQLPPEIQIIVGAIALGGTVGLMYWSAVFSTPSGQAFDLRDFTFFWWRELIVVMVFVVVLVFRAVAWLAPLVRRWMGVAGNDPKK